MNQRVALLESWKAFEETNGDAEHVTTVQNMFPIVSKKRKVDDAGQVVEGTLQLLCAHASAHTYIVFPADWDMVFADDERESNPTSFKFLQMAHAWAQKRTTGTLPAVVAPAETDHPAEAAAPDAGEAHDDDSDSDAAGSDVASSHGSD